MPDGSLPSRKSLEWHWMQLLKRAELPSDTRFHDLRHGAATMLLEANVNIKHIQAMLGHSSISTTLNIYAHHLRSHDTKTADAMNQMLEEDE